MSSPSKALTALALLAACLPALAVTAPAARADALVYDPWQPGYHRGDPTYYNRYRVLAPDWFERHDSVTLQAGDAVQSNKAIQMRDPWPPYVANRDIPFNGKVMEGAIDRYTEGGIQESPPGYGSEFGAWTLSPTQSQ
jgi:hypothetical protein